jgi:hypothetical protein
MTAKVPSGGMTVAVAKVTPVYRFERLGARWACILAYPANMVVGLSSSRERVLQHARTIQRDFGCELVESADTYLAFSAFPLC